MRRLHQHVGSWQCGCDHPEESRPRYDRPDGGLPTPALLLLGWYAAWAVAAALGWV